MQSFLAKSNPIKSIEEHTQDALDAYDKLKTMYPKILSEEDWLILKDAVLYHDLGKIDVKFQNKIRKAIGLELILDQFPDMTEIPHNVLSCAFLDRQIMKEKHSTQGYDLLAKAVYYHHARSCSMKNMELEYLATVMQDCKAMFNWNLASVPERLNEDVYTNIEFDASKKSYDEMLKRYLVIKGLLNRIDYTASAGVDAIEEPVCENGIGLTERIKGLFIEKGHEFRPVQQYMIENRGENLVAIAATGCGKTEAALLWIGNCKGFYTLPLKVSINAIFNRIKNDIGYLNTGLLHSDALNFQLNEQGENKFEEIQKEYTCAKLLAKPLTVSTIDQLLKFVFKYNGGEVQLSTLSYSRLVIDEIQMYSQILVAVIIVALKQITELGGKFAIVTATFPPVLYKLMEKYKVTTKPLVQKIFHSEFSKRHRIKLLEEHDFNYDDIAEQGKYKKVLIIANTVARAQELYDKLRNTHGVSVKLLHSSFMKKDRSILENNIINFAANDFKMRNPDVGIWISTQIVEASLDIDFDVLFTEMSTIDSLLQRFGRVYRSRIYDLGTKPNIFILDGKNGYGRVIDKEIYDFSLKAIKAYDGELLEESDNVDLKQRMINMVYDPEQNPEILTSKYYRAINETINTLLDLPMYKMDKKEVDIKFRDIQAINVIPERVYNELRENGVIQEWLAVLDSKELPNHKKQLIKDEIFQHTISVSHFEREIDFLEKNNRLYEHLKIFVYRGEYDFNQAILTGKGLIRKRNKEKGNQIAPAEFL